MVEKRRRRRYELNSTQNRMSEITQKVSNLAKCLSEVIFQQSFRQTACGYSAYIGQMTVVRIAKFQLSQNDSNLSQYSNYNACRKLLFGVFNLLMAPAKLFILQLLFGFGWNPSRICSYEN